MEFIARFALGTSLDRGGKFAARTPPMKRACFVSGVFLQEAASKFEFLNMPWAEQGLRYVQFDNLYVVNSKMSVKPHRFVIIHRCVRFGRHTCPV